MLTFSLLVALFVSPALASWGISAPEFQIEGASLERDQIFARIDSLEAVVEKLDPAGEANAKWRLAQLYISTDMTKHRRHALDLLDEVTELEPDNPSPQWL